MTNDLSDLLALLSRELPASDFEEVSQWLHSTAQTSLVMGEPKAGHIDGVSNSEILLVEDGEGASNRNEIKTEASEVEKRATDIRGLIASMTMAQKLKTAMGGNAIVRRLLIQDPSRLVQECVLSNPKLGVNEVEEFAKNTNVDAQVLRSISENNTWMRTYRVKFNLVCNPKCPPDLSLRWLKFLNASDMKNLARSKNVPQVLQVAAKKKISEK